MGLKWTDMKSFLIKLCKFWCFLLVIWSPKQSKIEESSLESMEKQWKAQKHEETEALKSFAISKTRMQGVWAGCLNDIARLVHFSQWPGCITSRILLPPTFHPDVSHPEFCCHWHSTRMSHIRNSSPPTFHPDISHPEFWCRMGKEGVSTSPDRHI